MDELFGLLAGLKRADFRHDFYGIECQMLIIELQTSRRQPVITTDGSEQFEIMPMAHRSKKKSVRAANALSMSQYQNYCR